MGGKRGGLSGPWHVGRHAMTVSRWGPMKLASKHRNRLSHFRVERACRDATDPRLHRCHVACGPGRPSSVLHPYPMALGSVTQSCYQARLRRRTGAHRLPLVEDRATSLLFVSGTPGALDRHTQQPLCYASCMIRPAQSRVFETGVRCVAACRPSSSPCRAITWYPQAPIAVQSSTKVPSGQRT